MEPAILPVIRQRFISRIDDGAVELHPLVNVVHDMVGTLAELELNRHFRLRQLEVECERVSLSDPASAGENLPGREKGQEGAEDRRSELRLALHQIVLVTS